MSMVLPPSAADRRIDTAASTPTLNPAAAARPAAAAPGRPPAVDKAEAGARAREMRRELQEALAEVNRQMKLNGRDLAFSLDDKADRLVIKVTNSQTGELVRQIPDETVLRIARSIEELKGVLYDESS